MVNSTKSNSFTHKAATRRRMFTSTRISIDNVNECLWGCAVSNGRVREVTVSKADYIELGSRRLMFSI